MKMTITRALAELKSYDAKINKAITETRFIDIYQNRANKALKSNSTKDEFISKANSSYEKIRSLIDRRNEIKRKVLLSNSVTTVTISGKTMTVVEAIEYKASVQYERLLHNAMTNHYSSIIREVEMNRVKLDDQVEKMVIQSLGKDRKTDKEDYDAIANPILEANEMRLLDPLKLQDKIAELDTKISEFQTEVDFILSESNSKTEIDVTD